MTDLEKIKKLENNRDSLIIRLWLAMRDLETIKGADGMSAEDAALWAQVAVHSAIKEAPGTSLKYVPRDNSQVKRR